VVKVSEEDLVVLRAGNQLLSPTQRDVGDIRSGNGLYQSCSAKNNASRRTCDQYSTGGGGGDGSGRGHMDAVNDLGASAMSAVSEIKISSLVLMS